MRYNEDTTKFDCYFMANDYVVRTQHKKHTSKAILHEKEPKNASQLKQLHICEMTSEGSGRVWKIASENTANYIALAHFHVCAYYAAIR